MTRVRAPASLRTRVTLAAWLVTLVTMAVAGVAMTAVQRRQLFDAVDASLGESVDAISTELDVPFGRFTGRPPRPVAALALARRVDGSDRSVQLLEADGILVAAGGSLRDQPALIDPALAVTAASTGRFSTVDGDGHRFRIATAITDGGQILVAGYALDDVDRALRTQRTSLLVAIPLLSGLVALLVWQVLGRALRPVEAIRAEVDAISGQALDRRVSVPEGSVELSSLATTMNAMLDRLDASAGRQQRFVSDAAHELRSPLAGIRSQLEVNIRHPDLDERVASEAAMLAEAVRMQELIDDLLLLARADGRPPGLPSSLVDLDDLVFDEAEALARRCAHAVRVDRVSAAQVVGDAAQLRRVIRNLGDNAARHARSTVAFALGETPDGVELAVSDDGPGVPASEAETIFDRFTRLDEARARDDGGSGLGLSISREIVARHAGTIALDTRHVGGARFVVALPLPGALRP